MKQSSVSLVEEKDDVKVRATNNKKSGMFNICKEFCFILAVTFTAYATVLNSQSKTKKGPPPIPFFHRGSVVDDYYRGDLVQLMHQVTNAGLAFVMFYAPWDADSQDVRHEFEQAAQFYFKQIYFAGVNCWEPGSECRTTFKDVTSFPQLIAYNGPRKAIEYTGPYDADHMIRFVHSLLNPLNRVNTVTDVWKLRYLHDAVVVGHLKFEGMRGGPGYRVLYDVALRLAGRDHERHTVFAVFTHDKSNILMGVTSTPTVVLYLWNKKLVYDGELNSDSLYKWILERSNSLLSEINSSSILPHIKSGAALVMFTPRHPLSFFNPYYQMLRRIAVKFHSCGNSSGSNQDDFMVHILQFDDLYSSYEQDVLRGEEAARLECAAIRKAHIGKCATVSARKWNNLTCFEAKQYCLDNRMRHREKISFKNRFKRVIGKEGRSAEQLLLNAKRERCALLERAARLWVPKQEVVTERPTACQLNSSVAFFALDSSRHSYLATGLGLDLGSRIHHTAVVILTKEETLKLENDEVNEKTVTQLLAAYIAGEKNRFLRTSKFRKIKKKVEDKKTIEISELDSLSFQSVVLNNSQSVVVFYHSPYCSFCQSVSHIFLTVAYLLRELPLLRFTRVDGENNDLPWQYTVHAYPSILIFPAHRKSESRIFPQWLGLTVHSLSHFILANLDIEERVQGMLALCAYWGNKPEESEEGELCLRNVRASCLELISETLRHYRSTVLRLKHRRLVEERRPLQSLLKRLLIKLQYLKSAHLRLERVPDLQEALSVLIYFNERLPPTKRLSRDEL